MTDQTENLIDESSSEDSVEIENGSDSDYISEVESEITENVRRSEKQPKKNQFEDFVTYLSINTEAITSDIARNYLEAVSRPDGQKWKQAMKEELSSFGENKTWELISQPDQGTVVKYKWVFKVKCNSDGERSYRARLVAKGYIQKEGVDYTETFAPVVRHSRLIRMLVALAININLKIVHRDIKTAFLNEVLKERVYMMQPEGFI